MSSQFNQEEEKQKDHHMEDEYDEDCDEENDAVEDLKTVKDGLGSININESALKNADNSTLESGIKSHKFHIPKPTSAAPSSSKYDPAPWNEYFDTRDKINGQIPVYHAGSKGHVFLCLHGAGHSAMTFAALARILKQDPYNSTVVSFDFRGHGDHYCEGETELTQANLIAETITALKYTVEKYPTQSIIVVGHSMGGSIATKTVDLILKEHKEEEWATHVKGVFIIDVVEGSAMDALPFME